MVWKIALGILVAAGILAGIWVGVSYAAGVAERNEEYKQAAIESRMALRLVYMGALTYKTTRGIYPPSFGVLSRFTSVPAETERDVALYNASDIDCYAILKQPTKANDYLEGDSPELIWFKSWTRPDEYVEKPDDEYKLAGLRVD